MAGLNYVALRESVELLINMKGTGNLRRAVAPAMQGAVPMNGAGFAQANALCDDALNGILKALKLKPNSPAVASVGQKGEQIIRFGKGYSLTLVGDEFILQSNKGITTLKPPVVPAASAQPVQEFVPVIKQTSLRPAMSDKVSLYGHVDEYCREHLYKAEDLAQEVMREGSPIMNMSDGSIVYKMEAMSGGSVYVKAKSGVPVSIKTPWYKQSCYVNHPELGEAETVSSRYAQNFKTGANYAEEMSTHSCPKGNGFTWVGDPTDPMAAYCNTPHISQGYRIIKDYGQGHRVVGYGSQSTNTLTGEVMGKVGQKFENSNMSMVYRDISGTYSCEGLKLSPESSVFWQSSQPNYSMLIRETKKLLG